MLKALANTFKIPDLRGRILFTLGMLFICRIVAMVPMPGVDAVALQRVVESHAGGGVGGTFMGFADLFSGGAFGQGAVGALSIWPYISASIIIQLMTAVIPALERLAREGDTGRQKLNQYTRYLTLIICVFQGYVLAATLERGDIFPEAVINPGIAFRLLAVLTMTSGTMLLMWLGEQITERGLGNGISVVIMINIISRLPIAMAQFFVMFVGGGGIEAQHSVFELAFLLFLGFGVVAGTVMLTQGVRKVAIHTARRTVGRKIYSAQNTFMPLRVNYSGVMPIIFAGPLIAFPAALLRNIRTERLDFLQRIGVALSEGAVVYYVTFALLVLFFSFFWVATQFNAMRIADDLKRSGGYVPGIRPGKATAEFLDHTMTRVTFMGAVGLVVIAILPELLQYQLGIPRDVASFMGGTSLLIVVGVSLDTMRFMESFLLMRHYDGFLKHGRLRGRRA